MIPLMLAVMLFLVNVLSFEFLSSKPTLPLASYLPYLSDTPLLSLVGIRKADIDEPYRLNGHWLIQLLQEYVPKPHIVAMVLEADVAGTRQVLEGGFEFVFGAVGVFLGSGPHV